MTTHDVNFSNIEELLESPKDEEIVARVLLSLTTQHLLPDLLNTLHAEDLHDPHLGELWAAAQAVHKTGKPVTKRTILAERDTPAIRTRINQLAGQHVEPHKIPTAVQRIKEDAKARRLLQAAYRIAEYTPLADTYSEALEFAASQLRGLEGGTPTREIRNFDEALDDWWTWLDAPKTQTRTIATPWPELNDLLAGGIQPGRSYVIGGRPGEGKSIALLNIAAHAAQNGHPAVIFSVEMGETEVMSRILAAGAEAEYKQVTRRELDDYNRSRLTRYSKTHSGMPLTLVDKSDITVEYIAATCRTLKRTRGLEVIVVDYLQLLRESDSKQARERQVAQISRALKLLARELDCSVIVACQLNRNAANGERKPALSELRESGAIEQDADVVILLHHPKDAVGQLTGNVELIVAKNRTGRMGPITQIWKAYQARIANVPR